MGCARGERGNEGTRERGNAGTGERENAGTRNEGNRGATLTDASLTSKLPIAEDFAAEYLEYYRIMPLELVDGGTGERGNGGTRDRGNERLRILRVAVAGVPNAEAIADLELSYKAVVEIAPVELEPLLEAIRRTFAASESVVELIAELETDRRSDGPTVRSSEGPTVRRSDEDLTDIRDLANQPPVIRFVNLLIREAHDSGASDIHLEATRDGLRARLRIDGVLSELPSPPRGLQAAVVSRVKLLAELDIAERRAPQDGRVRVRLESRELDLRVSTVPTLFGESVVLRLLDRGGAPVGLDELGMAPETLEQFRRLASRSHGIILATGPTGSGKTTTLYAAMGLRNAVEEKIVTVEDPVEYHLSGVTQVPVHSKAGVSFGAALRSILRQDPDVLMVGEMRDPETAGIAVQAAMTGHLVFSTLHTNDAVSALTRMADLRVEPYMIAATVEAVLAQRLVRKICAECVEEYRPDASVVSLLTRAPALVGAAHAPPLRRGRGCAACRQTGYRGRTGIYELFVVSDDIRHALAKTDALADYRRIAEEQGMVTLRQDGWRKVEAGITTVEEVVRVVG